MLERYLILINYEIELSSPSQNDLKEIHEYVKINFFSEQAANAKVDLILKALEVLTHFPESFPTVASRGYGHLIDGKNYRYMPIENYIAFFYVIKRKVYISRILKARHDLAKLFMK